MGIEEAAGVPQLVAEVSTDFKFFGSVDFRSVFLLFLFHGQTHVLVVGAKACHHEAESIGTVLAFDVHGIHAVAFGLAHGLSVAIQNFRMDIDSVEGDSAHIFLAEQHHAGHPESDDVPAGDQNGSGVVALQSFGVFGPTHSGMGP